MHDSLIRRLASNGKVKIAATRGPGSSWLGSAPRAEAFRGFQYLTVPLKVPADVIATVAAFHARRARPAPQGSQGRDSGYRPETLEVLFGATS